MSFESAISEIRNFMWENDDLDSNLVQALTKAVDSMDYLATKEEELDEEI